MMHSQFNGAAAKGCGLKMKINFVSMIFICAHSRLGFFEGFMIPTTSCFNSSTKSFHFSLIREKKRSKAFE
jgi:hypothetical protein